MDPYEEWERACERARYNVVESAMPCELRSDTAIDEAERLLALAFHLKGVACPSCSGLGRRAYASTATWMGGVGGQAITEGVCDGCWGTGRTDRAGVDLRRLRAEVPR